MTVFHFYFYRVDNVLWAIFQVFKNRKVAQNIWANLYLETEFEEFKREVYDGKHCDFFRTSQFLSQPHLKDTVSTKV